MKSCRKIKKELVAYLSLQLNEQQKTEVEHHLRECMPCRKELERLQKVLSAVNSFKEEAQSALGSVDWSASAQEITEAVWEKAQTPDEKTASRSLSGWRWAPLVAGLGLGLLLGILLTYFLITTGRVRFSSDIHDSRISVPQDFVEKADLELARKQTIGYLETSQYLLSELLNSPRPEDLSRLVSSERLREVLTEKKYLNDRLQDIRLMKAKNICDQIEMLFLELLQLSPRQSEAELEKIRQLVEEKQLILKINLVKKELQKGEV